jgi:hypothetical protein
MAEQEQAQEQALQSVLDAAATTRELGPVPIRVRIAPDVWSALRRDQDLDRPLLAPVPTLSVPVIVDDDLAPGQWAVEMSDGTERSS